MKTITAYQWRIKDWRGKWITNPLYASEEDIHKTNPEAIRAVGMGVERRQYERGEDIPGTHPPFSWQGPAAEQARLDAAKQPRAAKDEP